MFSKSAPVGARLPQAEAAELHRPLQWLWRRGARVFGGGDSLRAHLCAESDLSMSCSSISSKSNIPPESSPCTRTLRRSIIPAPGVLRRCIEWHHLFPLKSRCLCIFRVFSNWDVFTWAMQLAPTKKQGEKVGERRRPRCGGSCSTFATATKKCPPRP